MQIYLLLVTAAAGVGGQGGLGGGGGMPASLTLS